MFQAQTAQNAVKRSGERRGFTLIELLVVIFILGALMGLVLSAVMRARARARQTQCLANMRNLAQALHTFADAHNGMLPNSGSFPNAGDHLSWGSPRYGWVVEMLPYTDQAAADRWNPQRPYAEIMGGVAAGWVYGNNSEISQTSKEWLICPADTPQPGKLSYVVNGGANLWWGIPKSDNLDDFRAGRWMDYDGDGQREEDREDRQIARSLGLMWPGTAQHNSPLDARRLLTNIPDGAGQTILLSENLHSGPTYFDPWWSNIPDDLAWHNWANPDPNFVAFRISDDICPQGDCRRINWALANSASAIDNPPGLPEKINGVLDKSKLIRVMQVNMPVAVTTVRWPWPYPSSNHGGGVNVVFADSHGQFLNENVDGKVYASLVSPEGSRMERTSPLYQPPLSDASY